MARGSGTIDLQSAGTTPAGSYAFSFSGGSCHPHPVCHGRQLYSRLRRSHYCWPCRLQRWRPSHPAGQTLTGSVLVTRPLASTTLTTSAVRLRSRSTCSPIDATHLKFIEMDTTATLSGDAYSQTSTPYPPGPWPSLCRAHPMKAPLLPLAASWSLTALATSPARPPRTAK